MELDRDLVEASLRGRTEAFAALVERYRYAVFGLCLNRLGNVEAAQDAAQEAFVKAFLELRRLKQLDRFAPWLKQIAANQCRMWHRRRPQSTPLQQDLPAAPSSPEAQLVHRQTQEAVLLAVGRLNPAQQQVVTLFYLEELSLKQIAAFLGVDQQTVNQRLYRARRNLKEEMLKMVEETLGQQKLAEDFTDQVIRNALKQGQQLLQEKRWLEAKVEFRKITGTIAEHPEAQRGLALALDGQVNAMLDEGAESMDKKLVQEALAALEEAYRLGARDKETVLSLAQLYYNTQRPADRARILASFAEQSPDPEDQFNALQQAAWSCRRSGDYQQGYTLLRRALAVEGLTPLKRFESYFAAGILLYQEAGQIEEWLAETAALYPQLAAPLSTAHYIYFRDRAKVLQRLGRYQEALETGQHFLDLLNNEALEDPIQRRWWRSDTLGQSLQNLRRLDDKKGLNQALETAQENLGAFKDEQRQAIAAATDAQQQEATDRTYQRFVFNAVHNLGCFCLGAECFAAAIALFEQSLQIREVGPGYMFLASAQLQNRARANALAVLKRMRQSPSQEVQKWIFLGEAKKWFDREEAFAPVRDNDEFASLVLSDPDATGL